MATRKAKLMKPSPATIKECPELENNPQLILQLEEKDLPIKKSAQTLQSGLGAAFWFLKCVGNPERATILLELAIDASNKLSVLETK